MPNSRTWRCLSFRWIWNPRSKHQLFSYKQTSQSVARNRFCCFCFQNDTLRFACFMRELELITYDIFTNAHTFHFDSTWIKVLNFGCFCKITQCVRQLSQWRWCSFCVGLAAESTASVQTRRVRKKWRLTTVRWVCFLPSLWSIVETPRLKSVQFIELSFKKQSGN